MSEDETAKVKAGDQVWHPEAQSSLIVAAVDLEAAELIGHDGDAWIGIDSIIVQKSATASEHRAALTRAALSKGRRGEVARHALAHLWSDGKLATS